MSNCSNNGRWLLCLLIALAWISCAPPGWADTESDYLLFPFIDAQYLSGLDKDSNLDDTEYDAGVDLFAAIDSRGFLLLGEALLAKDEQEVERLQFGRRFGDHKVWLGRFHNPIGYWNTQFHHGAYLETSITRPAIVEYEDDSGPLPMHLTGLLIEGLKEKDNSGLGYAVAIASGPELSDKLESLDILDPGSNARDLALAVNLYRESVAYASTRYGLFANYTEIPAADRGIDEVHQFIVGAYWNWESEFWQMIGSTLFVRNRLYQVDENQVDDFFAGYFQAERSLNEKWKIFGRVETTSANDDDAYLSLFPDYARKRLIGGLRLNFLGLHALKLEISSNRTSSDRYQQLMLQWTALF